MVNRVLYWFITLPLLGKLGMLGTILLLSCCMLTSLASIPAAQARRAAEATQVALDSTATTIALATSSSVALAQQQATETAVAIGVTQTSIALSEQVTAAALAASTATAEAVVVATNEAASLATSEAVAMSASATALAAPTPVPVTVETVEYIELSRNEEGNRTWVNILIPPGTERDAIIQLAQQLREEDVQSSFRIFDDASQAQQFVDSSIYYDYVRDKDGQVKRMSDCSDMQYCADLIAQGKKAYPYPEEWASEHYIAMINQMAVDGRLQWQLIFQDDYTTVDIDVERTVWGGRRNDGQITSDEAEGWANDYRATSEGLACCVVSVEVLPEAPLEVVITLEGDLATRPEEARRGLASGVFTQYQSKLGECLRVVRFLDTAGNPFPDAYTNTTCS